MPGLYDVTVKLELEVDLHVVTNHPSLIQDALEAESGEFFEKYVCLSDADVVVPSITELAGREDQSIPKIGIDSEGDIVEASDVEEEEAAEELADIPGTLKTRAEILEGRKLDPDKKHKVAEAFRLLREVSR